MSSYTPSLKLILPASGEFNGTWGTLAVNDQITSLVDTAVAGYVDVPFASPTADQTLTNGNGSAANQSRTMYINMTSAISAAQNVIVPSTSKLYYIKNSTTGGFAITVKTAAGAGVSILNGKAMVLLCNGTDVVDAVTAFSTINGLTVGLGTGAVSTNTAVGASALLVNTVGFDNTAIGNTALSANTTGTYNTAVGNAVMLSNTTGNNNTAVGKSALSSNITGANNTALGGVTLLANTSGASNTAVGYSALNFNTTGATNTAVGANALHSNTTGANNTALGNAASYTNTTGNYNVAVGYNALYANTTGTNNTATGYYALNANTTGNYNTASGNNALIANTTGSYNTASGSSALIANTTGSYNTATGNLALNTSTTASYNVATGWSALRDTTTGTYNVASGTSALLNNTTGNGNAAIGGAAMQSNTTASYNVGLGYNSLYLNTVGTGNVAIGYSTLFSTTGAYNTGLGYSALFSNTTGSGNTAITPYSAAGVYAPVFDPVAQNNRFCAGSTAVTNAYVQVAWTVVSDARDKTNFKVVPHGLEFVNKLAPVSFQFKESREVDVPHGPVRYGFRAQDVLALEGSFPVVVDAEDSEKLRFNESSLIPILVKALQELSAKFDAYVAAHP